LCFLLFLLEQVAGDIEHLCLFLGSNNHLSRLSFCYIRGRLHTSTYLLLACRLLNLWKPAPQLRALSLVQSQALSGRAHTHCASELEAQNATRTACYLQGNRF
jgi:hypothetical protein